LTEWLLALVPAHGIWLVAAATFLSCLALPIPASILMLAAGGFAAAGDLSLGLVLAAAWSGAVAGDQAGYGLGRFGLARLTGSGAAARARALLARRGGLAVFFSRWLVSALGPYVNFAAGAGRMAWMRFSLWGAAGEAVWVGLYVLLGRAFAGNLAAASGQAASLLGFLAAGAVALGLGAWLVSLIRAEAGTEAGPEDGTEDGR
jgi:membrane protein DedA with SNARE-associated domain